METVLRSDVEGRLLCLAGLDLRPDQLGRMLCAYGLDMLYSMVQQGRIRDVVPDENGENRLLTVERQIALKKQLATMNPAVLATVHERAGLSVFGLGYEGYPELLAERPNPSGVLIVSGDPSVLHVEESVAIVGTRKASSYGRQVARLLGAELADAGVAVISGLARGIDGAAHEGVVSRWGAEPKPAQDQFFATSSLGAPIGVIAHGHDHVYPETHRGLYSDVARYGAIVSERPIGVKPFAHYFPQRNKVIAGLARLVVVVESARTGGSMITANLASENGADVFCVPGSIFTEGSQGCHQLLVDGAKFCRGVGDLLDSLRGVPKEARGSGGSRIIDHRRPPSEDGARLLQSLDWDVVSVETLMSRCTGHTPGKLLMILHELEFDQWVARGSDGWFQRAAA